MIQQLIISITVKESLENVYAHAYLIQRLNRFLTWRSKCNQIQPNSTYIEEERIMSWESQLWSKPNSTYIWLDGIRMFLNFFRVSEERIVSLPTQYIFSWRSTSWIWILTKFLVLEQKMQESSSCRNTYFLCSRSFIICNPFRIFW